MTIRVLGLRARLDGQGMDAAGIVTDGRDITEIGRLESRTFDADERNLLASGGKPAHRLAEDAAADLLDRFERPDLIGFQGPLAHFDAGAGIVREFGDGAVLARAAGVPVVWDVMSADMRLGGLGLTVAAFFSHALARRSGAGAFAHLDLGARAMLVVADPAIRDPAAAGAVTALECGPGLGVLAALGPGERARGRADDAIAARILADPFYARMPPKLAPQALGEIALLAVAGLKSGNQAATLRAVVAAGVGAALDVAECKADALWLSGRADDALAGMIGAATGLPVKSVADLGLEPAAAGAAAMAYLAARVRAGLPTSAPGTTGVAAAISGAALSRP